MSELCGLTDGTSASPSFGPRSLKASPPFVPLAPDIIVMIEFRSFSGMSPGDSRNESDDPPISNSSAIVYTEAREGPRATKMFGIETIVSPPGVVCQRPPTETSPIYLTKQSVNSLKTAPTKKELDIGRERNFPSQCNRAHSFSLPAGIILFSSSAAAVRYKTRNTNGIESPKLRR